MDEEDNSGWMNGMHEDGMTAGERGSGWDVGGESAAGSCSESPTVVQGRGVSTPVLPVTDSQPPILVRGEREVYREKPGGADFSVTEYQGVVRNTGRPIRFHVASVEDGRSGAVCVVRRQRPDGGSEYLLARHWRIAVGEWCWEFPRGMAGADRDVVDTALRELREETGIVVGRDAVRLLQTMHADTGVLRDRVAVVLVRVPGDATAVAHGGDAIGGEDVGGDAGADHGGRIGDGNRVDGGDRAEGEGRIDGGTTDWELSNMRWVPAETLEAMIAADEIADGITLAAWCVHRSRLARSGHGSGRAAGQDV